VEPGPLQGLFIVELDLLEDREREGASFREAFQAEKMRALGLPAFRPVQLNLAESRRGTLRGIHAEPWEKFVHVAYGEVFAAVADLRRGSPTAGQTWIGTLDRTRAIFVERGLGNSYQATSDLAVYTYLVNEHWKPGVAYPAVRFDDPDLAIEWPILDERLQVSSKDRANPSLREIWEG
jgi:dTDP-4-dehydrorhamnose 3,5-epimerase